MRTRLGWALAWATLLGTVGSAYAADMAVKARPPVAPIFSWTGFYIGGQIDGAWGNKTWREDATQTGAGGTAPVGFQDASYGVSGVLGGGQIGFNYQVNQFVLGIEGDLAGGDPSGSGRCFSTVVGTVQNCSTNVRWVGTITGRIGAAFDRVLLYVKGGGAEIDEKHTNNCDVCNFGLPVTWTASETRSGWTAGVGVEYAFSSNWSAKLEYDYLDFGRRNVGRFTNPANFAPYTEDISQTLNLVKFGVNYRFGGPVVARY